MVIELPTGYYLRNFIELIDYVAQQYDDLLCASERHFYQQFHQLSQPAQMLYVRMLTRKGSVFRGCKLQYDEIGDTADAALALQNAGLITINDNADKAELSIGDVLPLFTKPEWLGLLAGLDIDSVLMKKLKALKRADLDTAILSLASAQQRAIMDAIDEAIYANADGQSFATFKLLFFGNSHQDLTEFVLRDLGLYRFEDYHIDKDSRLFASRQQIEKYLDYYQQIDDLENILTQNVEEILTLHQALPKAALQDKTLDRRIQRVTLTLARQLERLDALDEALAIYQQCELPPARERSARILVKQQHIDQALAICRQIMQAPLGEEEAVFGLEFGARTAKKFKQSWPVLDKYQPKTETITIEQSGLGVEADTALYFSQFGQCYFVENALFCSLFGLHYWQLIFAPVSGAFTNPFQARPHDLYSREFLANRQDLFDQAQLRLTNLAEHREDYLALWQQKFGTATPFVHWDSLDEALISKALERIPADHWQQIFARLWSDLRANRSGFPDLILFPDEGGYELVEVKGPGDKLQKNQLRWMEYFDQCGVGHRVLNVKFF
ncbi:MAG: hypothetical protein ACI8WB_002607 [Phenylobacterium sp.]|jgi:hypothetical protein